MSETLTTGGMYPPRNECCHGRLKRQCNECDLQEENQQLQAANKELKARIASIEKIIFEGFMSPSDRTSKIAEILAESPQQSLAHIQADAVEEMTVSLGENNGYYSFKPLRHEEILAYAQQLREADKGRS